MMFVGRQHIHWDMYKQHYVKQPYSQHWVHMDQTKHMGLCICYFDMQYNLGIHHRGCIHAAKGLPHPEKLKEIKFQSVLSMHQDINSTH